MPRPRSRIQPSPGPSASPTRAVVTLAILGWAGVPGTLAGQREDTTRVVPVAPLTVTVLRTSVVDGLAPYAVSAAGADRLRLGKTGAFLEEALAGLPGLQVQNRYNFAVGERLAVRGFGARAQFGVRGVKVLVDGVPATMPDGQSTLDHLDVSTLGAVEVLRGPASALYGNAAGGVVAFRTRPPHAGPYRQEARVVGGSDGLLVTEATASGTASGTGWIVGVGRLEYDGFRPDPTREGATYGGADRLQLNGQVSRAVAGGLARLTVNALDLDAQNPGSLTAEAVEASEPPALPFNVAQGTRKELSQLQAGLSWQGDVAGASAEVAAWGISRDVENPIPPAVIALDRRAGGIRALAHGEAGGGGLRWGGGVEVELQRDDRTEFENDGGARGARVLDQEERVRATGAFVQGGAGIGGRAEATAALRWDRFRFEARDRFVTAGDPDDSGARTMDAWSPSVGVRVDVAPPVTVWANVATSLETPTTTELINRPEGSGGFNPALEPQRATSFEVGGRGRLWGRLGWELVLFHTRIEDELVAFEVPEQPQRAFFRNAGRSEHEGVELTLDAPLGAGMAGRLGWTAVDARFVEYTVGGEDFGGNRVPGLAPNRVEAALSRDGSRWFWELQGSWTDAVPVDDANAGRAGSYTLVDMRAGARALPVGPVSVTPFAGVSNLLDAGYVAAVTVNAFGGRYYEPGPGRSLYVGATLAWEPR